MSLRLLLDKIVLSEAKAAAAFVILYLLHLYYSSHSCITGFIIITYYVWRLFALQGCHC